MSMSTIIQYQENSVEYNSINQKDGKLLSF